MTISRVSEIARGVVNTMRPPGTEPGEVKDVRNISPAKAPTSTNDKQKGQGGVFGVENVKSKKAHTPDIKKIVNEFNDFIESQKRNIMFRMDRKADEWVIRVIKVQTGELIRQIPSEEILNFRARLREITGGLIDKTV